jgi:iron complex transport system substrate-binding protein
MQTLIALVEKKFTDVAGANPRFTGKTALLLEGRLVNGAPKPATPDWRSEFLTQMGFTVAGGVDAADVLIWLTESPDEEAALRTAPELAKLKPNRSVFTDKELAGAVAFASPLSYPLVADRLPPAIAQVLA